MPTILPEANYLTDQRNRIRIYSLHDFVACISTTWNGCTPTIHNEPYYDLVPSQTADEYYLAFGFSSDYYINMKVFSLTSAFVVEDGYFFLGIYTDPDNNKHILYKYGKPIDVPAIDKVWIITKDGKIWYGEAPTRREDLVEIGTVDNTFFLLESDKTPPIIVKGKFPWAAVLVAIALAGIGGATYWAVETHKTDKEAEVKKYNTDKAYEFLNNVLEKVKNNPSLADPYTAILESWFGTNKVTWEMPRNINPHETTDDNTNPFEQFINWMKQNWYYIVFPLIGTIILVFKWQVIVDFFKDILDRLRRRR